MLEQEETNGESQEEVSNEQIESTENQEVEESKPLMNEDGDYVVDLKKIKEQEQAQSEEESEEVEESSEVEEEESLEGETNESQDESEEESEDESEEVEVSSEESVEDVKIDLPEGVDKLIEFMKETGGDIHDYVTLNTEYTDDDALIKAYYKSQNPDLDAEEISFLIEEDFAYDEDLDDERIIRKKNIAKKKAIAEAKSHFDNQKEKYYEDVKLTDKLPEEAKEAIKFKQEYISKQEALSKEQAPLVEHYNKVTNELFGKDFKGFDFEINGETYTYEVEDANKIKESQADPLSGYEKFIDSKTKKLADAKGYHKSQFVSRNADAIAKHFFELGAATAVKDSDKRNKNINMDSRSENDGTISSRGVKVKVVPDGNSSKLKIRNFNRTK